VAGQLIAKGNDRWLLRIYKGKDPLTKKRIYKAHRFDGNREQAQAELNRLIASKSEESRRDNSKTTVNQLFDQWFETVAQNRYSHLTFKNYQWTIANDVRSIIGEVWLSELQPKHIQSVLSKMAARGTSSNTRRRLYCVISTALDSAVAWGLLETNPITRVERPRREVKEMHALTQDEVRRFLAVTERGFYAEYFRTAVVTGMRPGELAGLRWPDVDCKECTISVQRSLLWKGKFDEGWMLVPPKTERGRRQITISKSLASSLAALKRRQKRVKRAAGDQYQDHGLIFADREGNPLYPDPFIKQVFKPALKRAGLPKTIRLYDLRHTSATLLLKAGEHIKVVSERLGHSNVAITLETYAHVLPGMQRDAANKMEDLLSAGEESA
jgi:integrase